MISFTVPSVPVAQPRQRHRAFVVGDGIRTANYTPSRHPVQAFKASIQRAASEAYHGAPLDGPVRLACVFVMPRPKRLMWSKRAMPRVLHIAKPDLDNVEKAVKDALKAILWRDDSQVAVKLSEKWYAAGDEQPHVEIQVEALAVMDQLKLTLAGAEA